MDANERDPYGSQRDPLRLETVSPVFHEAVDTVASPKKISNTAKTEKSFTRKDWKKYAKSLMIYLY